MGHYPFREQNMVTEIPYVKNQIFQPSTLFLLLCGYLFLFIERPWEVWGWLEKFHIERSYMLVTITVFAWWRGKKIRWGWHPLLVIVFLYLHYALAPFAFSMEAALNQGFEYFKMVVFYFLLIWSIQNDIELRQLIKILILIMFFYLSHSLWEYHNGRHQWRMGITRMIGIDQFANDPNTFSGSIAFSVPFLWFLWKTEEKKLHKIVYMGYASLALVCVILTGSRSGFILITLSIILSIIWKKKLLKKIIYVLSAIIIMILLWHIIPEDKQKRLETIWNPDAGPTSAKESTEGRIEGLKAGLRMFSENWVTGVGAGGENFIAYRVEHIDGVQLQSHNLLGELLGEMGLFGALIFLGQIFFIWRMSGNIRGPVNFLFEKGSYDTAFLGAACRQTIILLLVAGLVGHNLYRINWLWIGGWAFLNVQFTREKLLLSKVQGKKEKFGYNYEY